MSPRGSSARLHSATRVRWLLLIAISLILLLGAELALRIFVNYDSKWNLRIGAGKQCEYIRATGERAPCLRPVYHEALFAIDLGLIGATRHRGHIGADIRFGNRYADHNFAGSGAAEPLPLLILGATGEQGLR